METLKNLNKLWRTSALLPSATTHSDASAVDDEEEVKVVIEEEEEEEEEEESFFELELVMLNSKTGDKENKCLRTTANVGSSPVSILKPAPKFKVSLFRKSGDRNCPDLKLKQRSKVDNEEKEVSASTISTLIRENSRGSSPVPKQSTSKSKAENDEDSVSTNSSSKRFSKDVMHKYLKLKLIKPFHLKVAKRSASMNNNNKSSSSSRLFELKDYVSSPAQTSSTPSSSRGYGLRVVCKQLGKSRSASSMTVCNRRDEWLKVEHDDDGGIQSAILHCKRSFNSSRDSSVHSRSSSDSNSR